MGLKLVIEVVSGPGPPTTRPHQWDERALTSRKSWRLTMKTVHFLIAACGIAAAILTTPGSSAWAGGPRAVPQSIARQWDEQLLSAIRIDIPRPPVHARNLYHLSVAMYDAWAAYDTVASQVVHH